MRRWIALGCCGLAVGCASTPEVKQASASIGVSLAAVQGAQEEFRDAFIQELQEVRLLIGRSIVSSAVVATVEGLADQENAGNLIAISSAIKAERDAYRSFVDLLLAAEPGLDDDPSATVQGVFDGQIEALRTSADALERASPQSESVAALRRRADELESGGWGQEQFGDMVSLVTLAQTQRAVREGIDDLQSNVAFLQLIHATTHEWVTSDVTVDGADMAALIERLKSERAGEGGAS